MKCPWQNVLGFCVKADLMPCVGVEECVLIHGRGELLQGIKTPYAELKEAKRESGGRAGQGAGHYAHTRHRAGIRGHDMSNKDRASTKELTGWKLEHLKELKKVFPGYPNDFLRELIPTRPPAPPKADPPPVRGADIDMKVNIDMRAIKKMKKELNAANPIKSLKRRVKKAETEIDDIKTALRRRALQRVI